MLSTNIPGSTTKETKVVVCDRPTAPKKTKVNLTGFFFFF